MGKGFVFDKQDRISAQFLKQAKNSHRVTETLEERLLRESRETKAKSDKRAKKANAAKEAKGVVWINGVKYTGMSEEKKAEIEEKNRQDIEGREERKRAERRAKREATKAKKVQDALDAEKAKEDEFKAMIARRAKEQIAKRNNETK